MRYSKTKYDPKIHNRKSKRLKGYDYSKAGCYFITIVCQDRICRFGHVEKGIMILNQFGQVAHDEWARLSDRFLDIKLDAYQIMPDHMHGIIKIVGKLWQRNYYEHIIRNGNAHHNISEYIINNPEKWMIDKIYSI
ncbi:MAG: putative transposase [bacterium]|jgi:putative transposase